MPIAGDDMELVVAWIAVVSWVAFLDLTAMAMSEAEIASVRRRQK